MTKFHADDYVQFLKMITPQNMHDNVKQLQRFNVGEDCPVFDGLYDFCQLSAGGSIGGLLPHCLPHCLAGLEACHIAGLAS